VEAFRSLVYARPEYVDTLAESTAIAEHVPVDLELRGCPIETSQLVEVVNAILAGRKPVTPTYSVCVECKLRGNRLRHGRRRHPVPRPGHPGRLRRPLPGFDRGCYGCFGPMETPNTGSLAAGSRSGSGSTTRTCCGCSAPSTPTRPPSARGAARARRRARGGGDVSHTHDRTISVEALARVEGEGAMHVEVTDGQVERSSCEIYEPPRFFEALLRGRTYLEPPDITARICGICPVAYQLSAINAIESLCGVDTPDGPAMPDGIRQLRRLLYCGEWIESHVLHVFLLHAPDFLGYQGAIEMAADHRELVEMALRMRKAGNTLLEVVGGRAIHPINVRVGGFHRAPTRAELEGLVDELTWGRTAAIEATRLVAGFDFPELDQDHTFVALRPDPTGWPPAPPATRSRVAGSWPATGWTSRSRRGPSTSTRSTSRTRRRCTAGCATAAPTWSGRRPGSP
jgi:hypothetical protein